MILIREQRLRFNHLGTRVTADNTKRLHNRKILLIDIGQPKRVLGFMIGIVELESENLVLRRRRRKHFQFLVSAQWNLGNVGAAAWNNEALNGRECKVEVTSCQEWKFTGPFAQKCAEPALLLSFLADDGGNLTCQVKIAAERESLNDVLQGAENDIGKGCGESDGRVEGLHGEFVFAWFHLGNFEVFQGIVGAESMQFLLLWKIDGQLSFELVLQRPDQVGIRYR